MGDDSINPFIYFVLLIGSCFVTSALAYQVGKDIREYTFKEELVESGHAEYYLDEENTKQWRIKDCEETSE